MEKLTEKDSLILISGMWRIKLPDDKHPEAVASKHDMIVHRTKYLTIEDAQKALKVVNEWYRQRGGRPKVEEYMPELKVDKRRKAN